ncbi:C40 family peptidase [Corynebacterium freneyi]|uniref:C40 family peptidase n=1 Tax=Corynebacterium freneyi TaxID=134034 RepID=UPI001CCCE0E5|nr:C40 family peptidase [Corynebacterium freneyi]UBI02787.1 C40 family peptidase [Corynebacterium freneyi]
MIPPTFSALAPSALASPMQDVPRLLMSAVPVVSDLAAAVPAAAPHLVDDWWTVADAVAGQWAGEGGEAAAASLRRAAAGAGTLDGHATGIDAAAAEGLGLIAAAALDLAVIASEFLLECAGSAAAAAGAGPAAPLASMAGMQGNAIKALMRAGDRLTRLDGELADPTATLESIAASDVDIPDAPTVPAAAMVPASATDTAAGAGSSAVSGAVPGAGDGAPTPQAKAAVEHALSAVGTPYQWGGNTPGVGLDCSGLTKWAYGQAGVDIPRTAAEQTVGRPVDASELLPGDLVVWDGHVAMVVGDGKMVEAGDPVQVNPIRTTNMDMGFKGFWRPTG